MDSLPPKVVSVSSKGQLRQLPKTPNASADGSSARSGGERTVLRSPATALFDTSYQGGAVVEVFSAGGSNPTANWKVSGQVQRVYDKSVKGYVFQCEGGPSAKMQLPKDERRLLGLLQPYLVLQLTVPSQKPFALELSISDTTKARRRVLLSTSFREAVRTPLHTRLPLAALHREVWLNLTFDMVDLVAKCFPGATFSRLESLTIHAACKVRRVFTLKSPPLEGASGMIAEACVPPATPSDAGGMHEGGSTGGMDSLRSSAVGSLSGGTHDGSSSPPPMPSPLPRGYELPVGTASITQLYSTTHALGTSAASHGGISGSSASASHHAAGASIASGSTTSEIPHPAAADGFPGADGLAVVGSSGGGFSSASNVEGEV